MQVLVVGNGHLGILVSGFATKLPEVQVSVASHHEEAEFYLDFENPATFGLMRNFDIVINCADSTKVSPLKVAEYCIRNGISFIEPSADSEVLRSLYLRCKDLTGTQNACLVLGVGIFPGLSDLLLAEAVNRTGQHTSVKLGVRVTPFSGAGRSTCRLMAELMFRKAPVYKNGRVDLVPAMSRNDRMRFTSEVQSTVYVDLPDGKIAREILHTSQSCTVMAFYPKVLMWILPVLARTLRAIDSIHTGTIRELVASGLYLLRTKLLRSRPTSVEFAVEAVGEKLETYMTLKINDGMKAGALAICTCIVFLSEKATTEAVVFLPQIAKLNPFLDRMKALASGSMDLDILLNSDSQPVT